MSDLDGRLSAALRADPPPARDVLFRVEVLVRLERARFRRRVALTLAAAAVVAVVAALSAPAIDAWIAGDIRRLWVVALGAAAALLAPAAVPVAATPGVRMVVRACGRWLYP
jgi:hypothetical protein